MTMTKHELDNSRWWERAACIGYPIDLFVAKPGIVGNRANQRAKDARAVCAGCDVSEGCLIAALYEGDLWAIRGGLLPNQRAGLAVKYGIRAQIKHGTEAGARRIVATTRSRVRRASSRRRRLMPGGGRRELA